MINIFCMVWSTKWISKNQKRYLVSDCWVSIIMISRIRSTFNICNIYWWQWIFILELIQNPIEYYEWCYHTNQNGLQQIDASVDCQLCDLIQCWYRPYTVAYISVFYPPKTWSPFFYLSLSLSIFLCSSSTISRMMHHFIVWFIFHIVNIQKLMDYLVCFCLCLFIASHNQVMLFSTCHVGSISTEDYWKICTGLNWKDKIKRKYVIGYFINLTRCLCYSEIRTIHCRTKRFYRKYNENFWYL